MKNKKFLSGALAAALALSLTTPALAAGSGRWDDPANPVDRVYENYDSVGKNEWDANHDTIISIFETDVRVDQLSFEVPLYVTMAVVDNQNKVVTPDNYRIYNTTRVDPDNYQTAWDIGITGVSFTKLPGSTYKTIDNATTFDAGKKDEIKLSIGGVWMPALGSAATATVDLTNAANYDGTVNTPLYNQADGKPTPIKGGQFLALPINGEVRPDTRTASAAAAQFKVTYMVSALDKNTGKPIGNPYAGNHSDLNNAGLGTWNDQTHTWDK